MIDSARLRACRGAEGVLALLRDLGYPVSPVVIDAASLRRAGIPAEWNGTTTLRRAVQLEDFELFVLEGTVADEAITKFVRGCTAYNLCTKSVIFYCSEDKIAIYDDCRRLDIELANPSAHAVDRINLLARNGDASLAKIFDRALDREVLTRRFFERFRAAVRDVAAALGGEEAEALLILSRLLFLCFVQEKGWLNGERRFLVDRLERAVGEGREFFATVLLPLFFGALNTPASDRDEAARALGRVPYLNGGLFEPSAYERKHPDLHLPNELMQRVLEDVFERFDFAVDERDAAGTHIDPEMLGKVFESLMAEDERARSGSFYTPRQIVDVLTSRAISEWLGAGDAAPMLERLQSITILDPACGSGAFLLSALGAIERLTRELSARAGVEVPRDLRQRIVERSLYGVDVKPEAVRLCELRLWLAIVSGSDAAIEDVRPLPNLDRNILQGNSLLSPTDFLGDGRADVYHEWAYALRTQRDLVERYRTAPSHERPQLARVVRENDRRLATDLLAKSIERDERALEELAAPRRDLFGRSLEVDLQRCRELRERIAQSRKTLERAEDGALDFFSFDVHFAPVMAGGGFDVVAGNPPWVRHSRIDAGSKRMYFDRYAFFRAARDDRAAIHQPDLSVAFFERAVALAAPGGVVSILLPAKVLNAAYATPLRRHARQRLSIVAIDDWSDSPKRHFDADTFPLGLTVRKRAGRGRLSVTTGSESFTVAQRDLSDNEWELVPPEVGAILRGIRAKHQPLAAVLQRKPLMGVKTGDNSAFFLEDIADIPLEYVARCVRGRDLRRWSAEASQWMLWPPLAGFPAIPVWLKKLAKTKGMKPSEFRLSYVRPEHRGIKVAWKDVSRGMVAAVLPDTVSIDGRELPLIPNQTLYFLNASSLDEAHLLAALLNSTIADALLLGIAERAKDAHFRYFGRTVARMPWPVIESAALHRSLVALSRKREAGEALDVLAADAYGIKLAELKILQRFVAGRLGHAR
ncbi:MAG TPA: N-6 DNA methylase [Thermoanaerobaculia bacterium]|jgi:SAM-dependent methyltransferase|nr:N-6 DNA methylase [Thermoanaerobaculia bacterium]